MLTITSFMLLVAGVFVGGQMGAIIFGSDSTMRTQRSLGTKINFEILFNLIYKHLNTFIAYFKFQSQKYKSYNV